MRLAGYGDIPNIVDMGEHFHALTDYPAPYNRDTAARTLKAMIEGADMFIIVDGDPVNSAIGVTISPIHFNENWKFGALTFHWSYTPGFGRKLLTAAEDFARVNGANIIHATYLPTNERVGKLYERLGYKPIESIMGKVL